MRIPLGKWLLLVELRGQCRHNVVGICPRCYPSESRTLRNLKLALALAWLTRINVADPLSDAARLRGMAGHALKTIADMQPGVWMKGGYLRP